MKNTSINLLMDCVFEELSSFGLSRGTLSKYSYRLPILSQYCKQRNIATFKQHIFDQYIIDLRMLHEAGKLELIKFNNIRKTVRLISDYSSSSKILWNVSHKWTTQILCEDFEISVSNYLATLSEYQASSTVLNKRNESIFTFYPRQKNFNLLDIDDKLIHLYLKKLSATHTSGLKKDIRNDTQLFVLLVSIRIIETRFQQGVKLEISTNKETDIISHKG